LAAAQWGETYAIPGYATPFAPTVRAPKLTPIVVDGFDVEGYSTGLKPLNGGPFDPTLPANIIAGTKYGFAWYDASVDGKPGPYSYTVVSCAQRHDVRGDCSTKVDYFNQIDTGELPPTPCMVLAPMSPL
jgi:hypothetical protein